MIPVVLLLALTLAGLVVSAYLLGFRLGGDHLRNELYKVRLESVAAQRRMHDFTREAFVAMAEATERRRP